MRMWMVPVQMLCRQHLLGEHGELHKHMHNFVKQHSMEGRIRHNCLEPKSYKARHDELAQEMLRRGMKHQSPIDQPDISYLPMWQQDYKVDVFASLDDLYERCPECAARIDKERKHG